jgi:hypothetical protein
MPRAVGKALARKQAVIQALVDKSRTNPTLKGIFIGVTW